MTKNEECCNEENKFYTIQGCKLIFNYDFDDKIRKGDLPTDNDITDIIMNDLYDKPIDFGVIPSNFKRLKLGSTYDWDLTNKLPKSVKQLELGENYNGGIPKTIEKLYIPKSTYKRNVYPRAYNLARDVYVFSDDDGFFKLEGPIKKYGDLLQSFLFFSIVLSIALFFSISNSKCYEKNSTYVVEQICWYASGYINIGPNISTIYVKGNYSNINDPIYLPISVNRLVMDHVDGKIPTLPQWVNKVYISTNAYSNLESIPNPDDLGYDLFVYSDNHSTIKSFNPKFPNIIEDVEEIIVGDIKLFARKITYYPLYQKIIDISSISEKYSSITDCSSEYIIEYIYATLIGISDNLPKAFSTTLAIPECSTRSIESAIDIIRKNSLFDIKLNGRSIIIRI